jgi:hypothetical protein
VQLPDATPDDWGGWGYRHIAAKHGWGPEDVDGTLQTLASPVTTVQVSASRRRFFGINYRQRGAFCRRVVVVEYERGTDSEGNPDPEPIHIVTSFGEDLTDYGG